MQLSCQILFSIQRIRHSHFQLDHLELAAKEDLDDDLEMDEDMKLVNVTGFHAEDVGPVWIRSDSQFAFEICS